MSKTVNITNKRFGFWVAIIAGPKTKSGQTQWYCLCECGIKRLVTLNSLRTGNSTSCGCNHSPNLDNLRFGKLLVVKADSEKHIDRKYWICKCDCGNLVVVSTYKLRAGLVSSCGKCEELPKCA